MRWNAIRTDRQQHAVLSDRLQLWVFSLESFEKLSGRGWPPALARSEGIVDLAEGFRDFGVRIVRMFLWHVHLFQPAPNHSKDTLKSAPVPRIDARYASDELRPSNFVATVHKAPSFNLTTSPDVRAMAVVPPWPSRRPAAILPISCLTTSLAFNCDLFPFVARHVIVRMSALGPLLPRTETAVTHLAHRVAPTRRRGA